MALGDGYPQVGGYPQISPVGQAGQPVGGPTIPVPTAAVTADSIADVLDSAPTTDPASLARIQAAVSRYGPRRTAVAIGNSILACTGVATPCASWFEILCLRTGLIPLKNAGVSGESQTEIAARFAADVVAIAPDIVFIGNDAANSIGKAVSVQSAVTATKAMCNAALAAGIEPVLVACSPFNAQAGVSSYNLAYRRIAEVLNLKWLDPWAEMWGNGVWKVTSPVLTIDNLHPSGYGGRLAGYKAAEQYASKTPVQLPTISSDPAGPNKNALFQNSTGWTTGAQSAISLVPGTGEVAGNWLTYTVTAMAGWQTSSGPAITMTGFVGGDKVRAVFRVKTTGFEAAGSANNNQYSVQGVLGVYFLFQWGGGTGGGTAPQTRQITMSDVDGVIVHEFTWPSGYTTLTPQVIITRIGPSTPDCTVAIAQMQFYNVTKIPS
jgi:hypothetical protein